MFLGQASTLVHLLLFDARRSQKIEKTKNKKRIKFARKKSDRIRKREEVGPGGVIGSGYAQFIFAAYS